MTLLNTSFLAEFITDLVYKLTKPTRGKKNSENRGEKNEDGKCNIATTIKSFLIKDFIASN